MHVASLFETIPLLDDIVMVCMGLILGSFASMLAYRIPRLHDWFLDEVVQEERKTFNQSLWQSMFTRSRCTTCETKLGVFDLFPIVSWVLKRGKCQHCMADISVRYPLIEILSVIVVLAIYYSLGASFIAAALIIMLPFMMASLSVDFEHLILPDEFTVIAGSVGIAVAIHSSFFSGFNHAPWQDFFSLVACGIAYGFMGFALQWGFHRITGKEGLGWGDVKFFAVAGVWVGWWLMPVYLLLASGLGIVFGLVWRLFNKEALFPFGPALIMALYGVMIYRNFWNSIL